MSLRRKKVTKEVELVSLIDVVFLLIIFGLAISLFRFPSETGDDPAVDTLRIELVRVGDKDSDTQDRLRVRIHGSDTTRVVYEADFPPDDSLSQFVPDREQFVNLPACRLIHDRLTYFVDSVMIAAGDTAAVPPHIHVTVAPDTRMRLVNFILGELVPFRDRVHWAKLEVE
jgi:hypothetical protein